MSTPFTQAAIHEVAVRGGTIRYRELGEGEPIVFVHGLLVSGLLWRKVVPALAETHRCIVPDWPLGSHERAMAPEADMTPLGVARMVAEFLEALELDGVTLVGNDTGGAICQLVIAHHPERVGRLVLTDCDAYENFLPPMFRPLQWLAHVPGAIWALLQPARLRAVRRSPLGFGPLMRDAGDPITEDYLRAGLADRGVRRDTARFLRAISSRDTLAAAERFGDFERPVLIVWAQRDRVFPLRFGERLAAAFPDARLERVDDSRTFISEDQPERLAGLIAEFLAAPRSAARA